MASSLAGDLGVDARRARVVTPGGCRDRRRGLLRRVCAARHVTNSRSFAIVVSIS